MLRTVLVLALALSVGGSMASAQDGEAKPWWLDNQPQAGASSAPEGGAAGEKAAGKEAARRDRLVLRLKNVPAQEVAKTIEMTLSAERQSLMMQGSADVTLPVIVPDMGTNSLIVSASPDDLREIQWLVEELDRPRPMVLVKMLIANVTVSEGDAKGGAKGPAKVSGKGKSKVVGLPERSEFSGERLKKELELAGVASSAGKGVKELIRKVKPSGRFEVIARPQVMALDNQEAFVQIGRREPMVTGTAQSGRGGRVSQVRYEEVGTLLRITPQVSSGGKIALEIELETSGVGPEEDGVPIAVSESGEVTRATRIVTTTTKTTVKVDDGQTVVLSGMSTDSGSRREELLVIMTAHVVDSE